MVGYQLLHELGQLIETDLLDLVLLQPPKQVLMVFLKICIGLLRTGPPVPPQEGPREIFNGGHLDLAGLVDVEGIEYLGGHNPELFLVY